MTKRAVTAHDLKTFMARLTTKISAMQTDHPKSQFIKFELTVGNKFGRIMRHYKSAEWSDEYGIDESFYAFIELTTGDIYKADTGGKPAKHVRGNIFDIDPTARCTWTGIELLRKPSQVQVISAHITGWDTHSVTGGSGHQTGETGC